MYAGWKNRIVRFAMGRLSFSNVEWWWLRLNDVEQQILGSLLGQANAGIDLEGRCISSIEHGKNEDWSWACFDISSTIAADRLFAHGRRTLFPPANLRLRSPLPFSLAWKSL
jgi:hypothetical protein